LSGAGEGVCIEKALDGGIVISGLQVIEFRLYGERIAIEAKKRAN
jgi:hypothetical protein